MARNLLLSQEMHREFRTVYTLFAVIAAALVTCGQASSEDGPAFSVPLEQQPSGAFYIRGTLADKVETRLLVDTGSSYVVLSRATFKALQQDQDASFKRTIRGATASGRIVAAKVFELAELKLGEDCVLRAVEVVVLPGSDRDILGLSALERVQPFTFDIGSSALRFAACGQSAMPEAGLTAGTASGSASQVPVAAAGAPW